MTVSNEDREAAAELVIQHEVDIDRTPLGAFCMCGKKIGWDHRNWVAHRLDALVSHGWGPRPRVTRSEVDGWTDLNANHPIIAAAHIRTWEAIKTAYAHLHGTGPKPEPTCDCQPWEHELFDGQCPPSPLLQPATELTPGEEAALIAAFQQAQGGPVTILSPDPAPRPGWLRRAIRSVLRS